MEPILYSTQAVLRGALILALSLSVFAQIPAVPAASGLSTDRRTEGNSYNSYLRALATKYGSPDKRETKYYRNGVETGSSGEHLWWLNGDQYMEGSEIEHAITIGSLGLDAEIAQKERLH